VVRTQDPAQLLKDVQAQHRLVTGDLLVVLVEQPSTVQRVVDVRRIKARDWKELERHELSDLLCEVARGMPIPERGGGPLTHDLHTILCRPGLTVVDGKDAEVLAGWRYSNHLTDAFDAGFTLVTDHGWYDLMSDLAGHEPALDVSPEPALRVC